MNNTMMLTLIAFMVALSSLTTTLIMTRVRKTEKQVIELQKLDKNYRDKYNRNSKE